MAVRYGGVVHQSVERRVEAVDTIIGEGPQQVPADEVSRGCVRITTGQQVLDQGIQPGRTGAE